MAWLSQVVTVNNYFLWLLSDFSLCFFLVCTQGRFGLGCSQLCQCSDGVTCDPVRGSCICPMGKMGLKCERNSSRKKSFLHIIMESTPLKHHCNGKRKVLSAVGGVLLDASPLSWSVVRSIQASWSRLPITIRFPLPTEGQKELIILFPTESFQY